MGVGSDMVVVCRVCDIKMDTPKNRNIAHKKVYLLQELGLDLGFSFLWDYDGVYSPDLGNYFYNSYSILDDLVVSSGDFESSSVYLAYDNIVNMLPEGVSLTHWLELITSIMQQRGTVKGTDDLYHKINKVRKAFSLPLFDLALQIISEVGADLSVQEAA